MPARLPPELLARALELEGKLWTQERIAAELGVCRATINRALTKHHRRVLDRLQSLVAAVKARQVSQLEWMADESVQAWERSKLAAETVKTTDARPAVAGDGSMAVSTTTETTVRSRVGCAAYLAQARAALAEIREILGLDAADGLAAEKLALQTKDTDTPSVRDALSEAESRDEAFGESDDLEPPEVPRDPGPEDSTDPRAAQE